MIDPADAGRLQDVYGRESRSLLQYARESAPYAAGADRKVLAEVQRVAAEDAAAIAEFAGFLGARRVPLPHLGSFPMAFTDLNFVAIHHLVPKLIHERRQLLAALEADLGALTDPGGRAAVSTLAEWGRQHLQCLVFSV